MTYKPTHTATAFANWAFYGSRPLDTLPPDLVEQARKLAIGRRIADARERSRWTQENIADHLGLSTRGYQKVEERGTTSFERCEKLADFFDVEGVTAAWLWEARGQGPALSPLDALGPPAGHLDRIEAKLDDALDLLRRLAGDDLAETTAQAATAALAEADGQAGPRSRRRGAGSA